MAVKKTEISNATEQVAIQTEFQNIPLCQASSFMGLATPV